MKKEWLVGWTGANGKTCSIRCYNEECAENCMRWLSKGPNINDIRKEEVKCLKSL